MTNDDKQKFAEIMWGLADVFGGEISQSGLKVRFAALYEYRIGDIEAAGAYLLRYRKVKFPAVPTVSEIIEIIEKKDSPDVAAKRQADFVISQRGVVYKPDFDDEITKRLMSETWPYRKWIQTIQDKYMAWWRRDFVAAYVGIAERERYKSIRESIDKIDYKGLKRLEKP
jgi:hypothetical protein